MCLICSVLIIIVPFRREKIKTYSKSGVYLLTSNYEYLLQKKYNYRPQ